MTSKMTPNSSWIFELDPVENWAYMENVFTPEECAKIIKIGEGKIPQKATVFGEKQDVRDSSISWLYACDDMEWAFQRVTGAIMNLNERFFKFDLFGMTEGFQFTRYDAPSGKYGMHIDKGTGGAVRKLSITIQLSAPEDYEGGKLFVQFSDEPDALPTDQGKLLAFPSYVLHEVQPVTKGTRYSLVAWVTGKPFK